MNAQTPDQQIIDLIPVAVFWKDTHHRIVGCNRLFVENTGLHSIEQIIGKTDHELPWKEYADKYIHDDMRVMQDAKVCSFEESNLDSSGTLRTVIVSKAPLFDNNNKVIGVIGTYVDITDKKNAEQLKLEKQLAEKKTEYTKAAAGNIAHDLRSPLASINFGIEGIGNVLGALIETYHQAKSAGLSIPPISAKKLAILSQVIERCQKEIEFSNNYINMILNNLQHDRIDSNEYQQISAKQVLDTTLTNYPYNGDEKKLVNTANLHDFYFWGNEVYLRNIFNNLLKNAFFYIHASQKGGIYISSDENSNFFFIKFKDTAKGASPEILKELFTPYYSKRSGGTGLGLSFCKTVMKSFKGDITVESIEGEYIEFTLSFPKIHSSTM